MFFVIAHPDYYIDGLKYAESLRLRQDNLRVKMASATGLKSQMKKKPINQVQLIRSSSQKMR